MKGVRITELQGLGMRDSEAFGFKAQSPTFTGLCLQMTI